MKKYIFILPIILFISGLSAWRLLAILEPQSSTWGIGIWLVAWLGLTVSFILFWVVALSVAYNLNKSQSVQHRLMMMVAAMIIGLFSLLLTSPAGLSRVILELDAANVWSPNIFTATWSGAGDGLDWQTPFNLPTSKAVSTTLEIVATGHHTSPAGSEVWLVGATWSDGTSFSFDKFEADKGWVYRQITWGSYQNRPVWVSGQDQPAVLHWQGMVTGPLTLVFAKHDRAGEVTIHWNGILTQTIDLYTPQLELTSITLPVNQPAVWRANLPVSALNEEINIAVGLDPLQKSPIIIKKIDFVGIPGQNLAVTGPQVAGCSASYEWLRRINSGWSPTV